MSNLKCPLTGLTDTTGPFEVSDIELLRSMPDQGECSTKLYQCKVCNREFEVLECVSCLHYPHYVWPSACFQDASPPSPSAMTESTEDAVQDASSKSNPH